MLKNQLSQDKTARSNRAYLDALLSGDTDLINDFYQEVFPSIRKLVTSSKGTEDDARDIFQEAMLLIYYKSKNPAFTLTAKLSTYFYGVCRNLWGNRIQKKDFLHVTFDQTDKYTVDSEHIEDCWAEKRLLFDRAFNKLDPPCIKLLKLFFEGNTMVFIAKKMGFKSDAYARRRKHQCKERLVELVKREPGYDELCDIEPNKD